MQLFWDKYFIDYFTKKSLRQITNMLTDVLPTYLLLSVDITENIIW